MEILLLVHKIGAVKLFLVSIKVDFKLAKALLEFDKYLAANGNYEVPKAFFFKSIQEILKNYSFTSDEDSLD